MSTRTQVFPIWRTMPKFHPLLAACLAALIVKQSLLKWVPFNSDEAIVGLMARHILLGDRPVFFWGQAYMGSLDAFLVAGTFRLIGEGVVAIRLVQSGLYLLYLATIWLLALRLSGKQEFANLTAWLGVVPTVLVTTYTTASLGGYAETLVFGNLILWLGWEVLYGAWQERLIPFLILGLVGGLAFWTLGLAVVYLVPVGLLAFWRWRHHSRKRRRWLQGVVALAGFALGSAPWWVYNLANQGAALHVLVGRPAIPTSLSEHLLGFFLLGLPSLFGIRFPWSTGFSPGPVLLVSLVVYLAALWMLSKRFRCKPLPGQPGALLLLSIFGVLYVAIFLFSRFGIDATGRYLLPLNLLAMFGLAGLIYRARQVKVTYGLALIILILSLNGIETVRAAASPDRITTQFGPLTRFDNKYDEELLAFLRGKRELRGYTNYWVGFRLAFLSDEQALFAARLPYRTDLSYSVGDNRYPPYDLAVKSGSRTAYITTLNPQLDHYLESAFARLGITYQEQWVGYYHIFYQLSRPVHVEEIGL